MIEQRLLLGQNRLEAIVDLRRGSVRTGMIPIINSMAAAGLVSLPGMMTGQILFLIAGGTGLGVMAALYLTARRLFDDRHRLCLDRLVARHLG